jgi:hypothetical protein
MSLGSKFGYISGDQAMRVLAILALALSLTACNGDRMKDGNLQQPSAPAGSDTAFG